jgi:DNA polymerase-3 subunit delta'
MLYKNIIGQNETKTRLQKMVLDKRVPHALMFTGKEGTGNLPAALAFIQHLYCENKLVDDACDVCNSCIKVSKLIHPDLHFVVPIAKSKDVKSTIDVIKEFRTVPRAFAATRPALVLSLIRARSNSAKAPNT